MGAEWLAIVFTLSTIAAGIVSTSSIKPQWHREDYYARCVRPNILSVCVNAMFLGMIAAYLSVSRWTGIQITSSDNSIRLVNATWESFLAGTCICMLLCGVSAFILGRLFYGAGERAGYQ